MRDQSTRPSFGERIEPPTFESLLASGDYLALLHVVSADRALIALHAANASNANVSAELTKLLASNNWRPHLVAAAAIVLTPEQCPLEALWTRIHAGSWVTPQLLAAAERSDPNFSTRARALLADLTERVDPPGYRESSAKAAAAICALLNLTLDDAQSRALLAVDQVNSGSLALSWQKRLTDNVAALNQQQWVLRPRLDIKVVHGDLVDQEVDVIVNAWNRNIIPWWLLLPQGVSGAIKRRGGTRPFRELGNAPMPLGSARLTSAGDLPHKAIIHVAGIDLLWRATETSIRESVKSAIKTALDASSGSFESIAFPIIGAGSGGVSEETALQVMLNILNELDPPLRVVIVRYRNK